MIIQNDPLLEHPEFESFHFDLYDDPLFPRPPPEPPDVEISLIIETDAPVINNVDEINEDDDSFTFVIWTFLPFLTYPEASKEAQGKGYFALILLSKEAQAVSIMDCQAGDPCDMMKGLKGQKEAKTDKKRKRQEQE
ncbi:hypothetical protein Tco_0594070 [Tanacetum coccineum]